MRKFFRNQLKGLFIIWLAWSSVITGYEIVKSRLPMEVSIYEDDAVDVLAGNEHTIDPEVLKLDFAGDISMREVSDNQYDAVCRLFGMIPVKNMEVRVVSKQEVYPGGIPVGIYIQTKGVFVVGTGDVESMEGKVESPAKDIIKTGDYIVSIQGQEMNSKQELVEFLRGCEGGTLCLNIRRNDEMIGVSVNPVRTENGYSIGAWVRDDTQGVGTLTYMTEDRTFGALGHGISDADSELLMEVSGGRLYACEITEIQKGAKGTPGKLAGKINYNSKNLYGMITGNLSGGIYGVGNERLLQQVKEQKCPIALKQEIHEGEAVILSSVDGTVREYTIEIRKIYRGETDVNKGLEFEVTDERLLEMTGGIVQGMSGSPIIQDGKLVGAVTHVLVNDPTRGYGIFIENMLDAAG